MAQIYNTATEYLANELTFTRGVVGDITSVGVYHNTDPQTIPTVDDFTTVTLVDGTGPLAEGTKVDVLSLIGSKVGADLALTPGDYQRWVLVQTANEDIIRAVDTVTVL